MKKFLLTLMATCLLCLSACASKPAPPTPSGGGTLSIAATTWPVYCFTTAVTDGVEGVTVTPVINEQMSCLHDYTLTVANMKVLEGADVIVMNGLGLEDFMSDALSTSTAQVVDCSAGITPLSLEDGAHDPHIWMDPARAEQMVETIVARLTELDPDHGEAYQRNGLAAAALLNSCKDLGDDMLITGSDAPSNRNLITFHDGFGYFADSFGLTLLRAIEEEEGSETSAQEIKEIVELIETYRLPAIFTEVNGSDATAQAISRETGVAVDALSMIMSGEGSGLAPYLEAMGNNIETVANALNTEEVAGD